MALAPSEQAQGFWESLLRAKVFWICGAVALVSSPAWFWSMPVLGVAIALVGLVPWLARRRVVVLAVGAGLVAGSVPYAFMALLAYLHHVT